MKIQMKFLVVFSLCFKYVSGFLVKYKWQKSWKHDEIQPVANLEYIENAFNEKFV